MLRLENRNLKILLSLVLKGFLIPWYIFAGNLFYGIMKKSETINEPSELPPDRTMDKVKKELMKRKVQIDILKKIIETTNTNQKST